MNTEHLEILDVKPAKNQNSRHAVLLIHGLGGSPTEMNSVKNELEKAGYYVDSPLLPGHGTHFKDLKSVRWQDYVVFVAQRAEALLEKYETVSVSGICLGAVLALYLGMIYGNRLTAIAPISTTLFYDGWALFWKDWAVKWLRWTPLYHLCNQPEVEPDGVKDQRLRKLMASHMSDASSVHYSKIPYKAVWEMYLLKEYVKKHMQDIDSPVFATHAAEDEITSPKSVDAMRAAIPSKHFSARILTNSYHLATIDQERRSVAQTVRAFFDLHTAKTLTLA